MENSTTSDSSDMTTENVTVFWNWTGQQEEPEEESNVFLRLQTGLGALGMVSNATIILALGTHRNLRRKVPNMFIINQVSEVNSCLRAT